MTIRFFILLFVFTACTQVKKKEDQEHLVSAIISTDSVIIYSGKLSMTTPVQKITLDEKKVKEILDDKKRGAVKPVTVLLKLSSEGGQGGIMGYVENIMNWSKETGITSFERADGDVMDIARFKVDTGTWRYIDEMLLNPPKLLMPREETTNNNELNRISPKPIEVTTPKSISSEKLPDNNALLIQIKNDQSVWYQILVTGIDSPSKKVNAPVTKNLKNIIADFENKNSGVNKQYLIKGENNARYPEFEKVIEALKQNSIFKYNLLTENIP